MCEQAEGSTGETCDGMLSFVARVQPLIVIAENVPELLNPSFANWSYIKGRLLCV